MRRPRFGQHLASVDPWLVACCFTALGVYLLHGFGGQLDRDPAVYAYGGQQLAEGVPPYVAIANRAGPLSHVIPGLGVITSRAVGIDDLLGMRVLFMLISIACIGLAYLTGRDLFRSRPAGVVTAAVLLSFHGFIEYATFGPREKTAMVLFLLAALLAMTHQRWLSTGVLVSLATLTWQPVFFALIAGVVVAILLGVATGHRLRALGRVVVGGLAPVLLTLGTFAALGEVPVLLDSFVLINAQYTEQAPLLRSPSRSWDSLVEGYGASWWLLLVGLVALLVLGCAAAFGAARREPQNAALIGSAVLALVAIAWTLRAFNNWPDAFLLLPASALGVGALFRVASAGVSPRVAWGVAMTWVVATGATAVNYSVTGRDDGLDDQRESLATVMSVVPDARMLSISAAQPLVLAQQRNASRFQPFGAGMGDYIDDTYPGGLAGYGRWVASNEPTIIAFGLRRVPSWLAPTIERSYERVGAAPGWKWYVRRDVGETKLEELRRELDAQSWLRR